MDAEASGAESTSWLSRLLEFFPFLTHNLLRKLAHFSEYALLGAHLAFLPMFLPCYAKSGYLFVPVSGVAVALLDEGIQLFVPGRAGLLTDVLIDFSGCFLGSALFIGLIFLYAKRKEKKESAH
jgi:VanZ family protein